MAIKVEPFVVDAKGAIDLIGNDFKFDHAKGLAEWLKNACDVYLRERVPDDKQYIYVRLTASSRGHLSRIECIDFIGMDKSQINDAFKRFFDRLAAKKGAKSDQTKLFGGHGNGGKFYMRQMFKTSIVITYRGGKMNKFGFNVERDYGFEQGFEDRKMSPQEAMKEASIDTLSLPADIRSRILAGKTGFTVVRGEHPQRIQGTTDRNKLVEKLIQHPQARRLIERVPIMLLFNDETEAQRLTPQRLTPKEGFHDPVITLIPEKLEWQGRAIPFKSQAYQYPGRLTLKTSNDPLRGNLSSMNAIDFEGEVGIIASYRIHELGQSRFSGQNDFIYGLCECPILEDPDNDCVRNDRQKLVEEAERTKAILEWVRHQVEALAEKMELKNAQDKKRQDLKNTSTLNEVLNRWKNRFMTKIWSEVFVGKGPAGVSGEEGGGEGVGGSGAGGSGTGGGGTGGGGGGTGGDSGNGTGHEGGSETKRSQRFPQVLISGEDVDPLDSLATEPFNCDPRHPAIYRRRQDVEAGIYWINTARPLAESILKEYTANHPRWREYLFQRYVDIMVKESIYAYAKEETSLTAEKVDATIDKITTIIHDGASKDLHEFLFKEQFGAK